MAMAVNLRTVLCGAGGIITVLLLGLGFNHYQPEVSVSHTNGVKIKHRKHDGHLDNVHNSTLGVGPPTELVVKNIGQAADLDLNSSNGFSRSV
jgi:hypothetical protein